MTFEFFNVCMPSDCFIIISVTQCKSKERELRHAIDQSADKLKAVQQQHQFDQTRHEDERLKLQSEIGTLII
jgi:hypothetical protein